MSIRAVIFDCFGVLITDALEVMLEPLRESDPMAVRRIVDTVTAANRGIITSEQSRAAVAAALGLGVGEYVDRLRRGEAKNQPLLDYIATLRPHYKTALLSNTSSRGLEARFTPEELAAHFDVVVASGVVGYAKPEAQAYEITAERLGVRLAECVMVDDSEDYCAGARGVGMQTILYTDLITMRRELADILEKTDGA